ncbi:MAG: hypothetical protein PHQ83_11775 [Eubacteriales bacterium]|nr:hypothetical protein [Eubacteriales bacterium]
MKESSFDYEKRKRLLLVSVSDYIITNVHCEHLIEQTFHINFDIRQKSRPHCILVKVTSSAFFQSSPVFSTVVPTWHLLLGSCDFPAKITLDFYTEIIYT